MTAAEAHEVSSLIAAVKGASAETVQPLLWQFAQELQRQGVRVAGVVEVSQCESPGKCGRLAVRDLTSGALIAISQDLGPGSIACNLDPCGLAEACEGVERAIAAGADVVVLSKFGKLEAARGGLRDAFGAAILAELPIVTSVSPSLADEWARFAGPLSDDVAPRMDALDAWWSANGKHAALRLRRGLDEAGVGISSEKSNAA